MTVRKIAVDLYYDVITPYSWIAFELLCRYRNQWPSMQLRLKPFFYAAVIKGSNNDGPQVSNKATYRRKDWQRLAEFYQIPIKVIPDKFPNTLKAQRFLNAVDVTTNGQGTEEVSRQLWRRIFTDNLDVEQPDSLREAAVAARLNSDSINKSLSVIDHQEIKDRLKNVTGEALAHGAFGAPTMVAHLETGPQLLFGGDRIEILGYLLKEKYVGPLVGHSRS